jgi:hypothetical protein
MRTYTVIHQKETMVTDTLYDGSHVDRVVGYEPNKTIYKGFDRNFNGLDLEHVVLVTIDGELEVYALDSPNSVSSLVQYLADEPSGQVQILGCYSRK